MKRLVNCILRGCFTGFELSRLIFLSRSRYLTSSNANGGHSMRRDRNVVLVGQVFVVLGMNTELFIHIRDGDPTH